MKFSELFKHRMLSKKKYVAILLNNIKPSGGCDKKTLNLNFYDVNIKYVRRLNSDKRFYKIDNNHWLYFEWEKIKDLI